MKETQSLNQASNVRQGNAAGRLVRPHMTLGCSQCFRFSVDAFVLRFLALQKIFVRSLRYPVVGREVHPRFCQVSEQVRSRMVRIATKQGVPVATRSVDSFKPFFAAGLDFELPQD